MKSIKELRKLCQNKGYQEHPTIRAYRLFSIYITKIFLLLGLKRPEFVVGLGFLSGIAGGYFYLRGDFVLGSILFFAFMVFDHVDGEIARYRKLVTALGDWLDTTSGHLLYPYFFFTLGLGVYFQTGIFLYVIFGSIAAMAKLVERSVSSPLIKKKKQRLLEKQNVKSIKMWTSHIVKNMVLYPLALLFSIIGWEREFLWIFAIYLIIFVPAKIILTGWRIYYEEK